MGRMGHGPMHACIYSCSQGVRPYEVMCERMVISTRPVRFTPILSDNDLAYGSGQYSIHFLYYYCSVHEYFSDESIV
jgi:hypothetical protein